MKAVDIYHISKWSTGRRQQILRSQISVFVCAAAIFKQQFPYFLPACSCLCCSWTPSTAWWKSNTVEEGERGHTLSHTSEKVGLPQTHSIFSHSHTHTHTFACMHSHLNKIRKKGVRWVDQGGLTNMRSVWDDQSLLPAFQSCAHKATLSLCTLKHSHHFFLLYHLCAVNSWMSLTISFAFVLFCLFKQAWEVDHDTIA